MKKNYYDKLIHNLKDKKIIGILLIMFIVLIGFSTALNSIDNINKHFSKSSENLLTEKTFKLSNEILLFLKEREENEPNINFKNWENSTNEILFYSSETMNLYSVKFSSKVMLARDQFKEKGFTDSELDKFYEHPVNQIGIRIVGERLGLIANKLKDQVK